MINLHKRMLPNRQGSKPQHPDHQLSHRGRPVGTYRFSLMCSINSFSRDIQYAASRKGVRKTLSIYSFGPILQTMIKTPVKFQKDRSKTVGGVALTRYLLQTRNQTPCIMHHGKSNTMSPRFSIKRRGVTMCTTYSFSPVRKYNANFNGSYVQSEFIASVYNIQLSYVQQTPFFSSSPMCTTLVFTNMCNMKFLASKNNSSSLMCIIYSFLPANKT